MAFSFLPRRAIVLVSSFLAIGAPVLAAPESPDADARNVAPPPSSHTDRYRVVWTSDPTREATIAWQQISGSAGSVHLGRGDHGRDAGRYPVSVSPSETIDYDGMRNCFARVSGLEPGTEYFFCIRDESGVSPRFRFETAPAVARPFTFVAGGDSRNFRDVRIAANQLASKLRPLFIAFTGDMVNKDEATEWRDWLDDWQETISDDGRIIPIVPHRGNHEKRPETIPALFGTPPDAYFAFSIGADLFRYYALNSEIPAMGAQKRWLAADLARRADSTTHLVAGYHKPMRPHVSAKSEGTNPMRWARLFHRHGLDLALESDSHVMKRTRPIRPDVDGDEGFSAAPDDPNATVYIGEGCWGAPLRSADDPKSWTIATESFNGLDWIEVTPERIRVKTVRVENVARVEPVNPEAPFTNPAGLQLWKADGDPVLAIPAD